MRESERKQIRDMIIIYDDFVAVVADDFLFVFPFFPLFWNIFLWSSTKVIRSQSLGQASDAVFSAKYHTGLPTPVWMLCG